MTSLRTDEVELGTEAAYDLIICHDHRIVFHDHYASPALRLRMLVQLLELSDVVSSAVNGDRVHEIRSLHQSMHEQSAVQPDQVVNAIAKTCRRWGIQIYVSTTRKRSAAPQTLYSVVTDYGSGQIVAEHFADAKSRRASLIERVDQCLDAPGHIPKRALSDDARLAALLSALLLPASVSLTESVLDESGQQPLYRPSGALLPIR